MAILLSLLSALSYGLSDFVGGVTSKRTSPWSVALVGQTRRRVRDAGHGVAASGARPPAPTPAWAVVAGAGNGFGTAFLYRGLSSGRMGVVAPVSGVGAALVPVVPWRWRPASAPPRWCGSASSPPCRASGWWRANRSRRTSAATRHGRAASSTACWPAWASAGCSRPWRRSPSPPASTRWRMNQVVAAVVIIAVASALRTAWLPRQPVALLGAVSGTLGALATGAFLLATQTGYLTVTAVLASLYPAVTVLLAATVLRERVHRGQAVGLVLCGVAVALVAAG